LRGVHAPPHFVRRQENAISIENRKGRFNMRSVTMSKKIVPAALFAAALAVPAAPLFAADVGQWTAATDVKDQVTVVPNNYCDIKIPAPNNDKASGNDEDQMTPQWSDWIDYSGPCDQADEADAVRQMKQTSPDD
jgi:hypothetical protein